MIELELLGIGADGETLVFSDANGERYCAPITDELRTSVRRDRPKIEAVPSSQRSLRPREIQSLLRAGVSAEEIAADHEMDVTYIQRFEAPIDAEKDYALSRALNIRIGDSADGPLMGELVIDRLAARGVSPHSLRWTARRDIDCPWEITVTFVQGTSEHSAAWQINHANTHLEALDQEARWLTETATPAPIQAIFSSPVSSPEIASESEDDIRSRDALIDQLNAARGRRVDIDLDTTDGDSPEIPTHSEEDPSPQHSPTPSISARIYSIAQSRTKTTIPPVSVTEPSADEQTVEDSTPATSAPSSTPSQNLPPHSPLTTQATAESPSPPVDVSDRPLPGFEDVENRPSHKKRRKRRSVPSWDEIVFGSKLQ